MTLLGLEVRAVLFLAWLCFRLRLYRLAWLLLVHLDHLERIYDA